MKNVFDFHRWSRNKIAVFHMMRSSGQILVSLDLLNIPYEVFEGDEIEEFKKFDLLKNDFCGIIISGGLIEPYHIKPTIPDNIIDYNLPKLGICLGHEILGTYLGSDLIDCSPETSGEQGEVLAELKDDIIFKGIDISLKQMVKMEHHKMLDKLPPGSNLIASTKLTPIAGFHHEIREIWGLQFHPEKDWMYQTVLQNFYKYCYNRI